MTFDSQSEKNAFYTSLISEYPYEPNGKIFNTSCKDSLQDSFNWKADFIALEDSSSWLPYIEFKQSTLNSRKTKLLADKALQEQLEAGFTSKLRSVALYSWSNSKHKQSIVQGSLPPMKHLIVFQQTPTEKEARAYDKLNLFWCTLASFPSCMAFIFFTSVGLKSSFQQYGKDYVLVRANSIVP